MTDSPNTRTMSRRSFAKDAAGIAAAITLPAVPAIADVPTLDDEGPLTAEQTAAFEFEPWVREPGGWTPPTGAKLETPCLVTLRIAHAFMFKTKAELIEILDAIDEEAGQALFEGFRYTVQYFKMLLTILEAAEARIICAGSVIELREMGKRSEAQAQEA